MDSRNQFSKPSIFTGQCYDKKISVQLDHSDIDINELFDAFKSIALGLGFAEETWNEWIKDGADDLEFDERMDEWNEEDSEWQSEDKNEDELANWDWDEIDTGWVGSTPASYSESNLNADGLNESNNADLIEDEGPEFDSAGFSKEDRNEK